jgi:hypothetical protein
MTKVKSQETQEEEEENGDSPQHDATGSRGVGVFQDQSGRSSINTTYSK